MPLDRTAQLHVALFDSELAEIMEIADALGVPVGDYVRATMGECTRQWQIQIKKLTPEQMLGAGVRMAARLAERDAALKAR